MVKSENGVILPGITPGALLQIQFEGLGSSQSRLIGIDAGKFLIIQTPAIAEIWSKRYEKNHCIVRYVFSGKVYAFRCTLLAVIKDPFRLSILSYPASFENINLRKHERISCIIAAEVNVKGQVYEGIVSDISAGGCSFEFDRSSIRDFPQLQVQDFIHIYLQLGDKSEACVFSAAIRGFKSDKENMTAGLQFMEPASAGTESGSMTDLKEYISSLQGSQ